MTIDNDTLQGVLAVLRALSVREDIGDVRGAAIYAAYLAIAELAQIPTFGQEKSLTQPMHEC